MTDPIGSNFLLNLALQAKFKKKQCNFRKCLK